MIEVQGDRSAFWSIPYFTLFILVFLISYHVSGELEFNGRLLIDKLDRVGGYGDTSRGSYRDGSFRIGEGWRLGYCYYTICLYHS